LAQENRRINIFPFTSSFFKDAIYFERYIRETLPKNFTVEHTQLRKPDIMVFAYQGDHSFWGFAEVEGWTDPAPEEVAEGREWGGTIFRRVYKIKPCSIKEFAKHVPYFVLDFNPRSIVYAPKISVEIFNQLLRKAEGQINCCIH